MTKTGKSENTIWLLPALLIVAAGLWVYLPVLHGDWLWDDQRILANNVYHHDPSQWWRIWLQPENLIDFQPIKATVVCLQWYLWGSQTFGYHLTNLVLHLISALLVWRLLDKFGLKLAWLGGLLFAIHPVMVESVAWIVELKNTLSMPPFLLAMCCYLDYDQRGRRSDYLLALGLFLVALLCKATMVMFPFVILLYAWWKRDRIGWNDLKASLPFFGVSLVLGLLTVWFLQKHAINHAAIPLGGFASRVACAGLALSFYFAKCVWPTGLLPIYPQWNIDPPTLLQFVPWPILAGVFCWLWMKRASWGRYVLLGLGFFVINLVPFLGFTAGSYMRFTWVMDHILYLPIIGLIGLMVATVDQLDTKLNGPLRAIGIGILVIALGFLAREGHRHAKDFVDQETLWSHTLRLNPAAWPGYNNLGLALMNKGRYPEAIALFEKGLLLKPDDFVTHNSLGNTLIFQGKVAAAIVQYREALRINPDYDEAHNGLGNALLRSGQLPEARSECEKALQLHPDYPDAHCTLGLILAQMGELPDAIAHFETAAKLEPNNNAIKTVLESLRAQQQNAAPKK